MKDAIMRFTYKRPGCMMEEPEPITVVFPDSEEFHEALLLTSLGNGRWRMEETPVFSMAARYHDIIEAVVTPEHDLAFVRVVQPSGMRTVRYLATDEWLESPQWAALRDRVMDEGGEWEQVFGVVLMVHVPLDSPLDLGRAMRGAGAFMEDTAIEGSTDRAERLRPPEPAVPPDTSEVMMLADNPAKTGNALHVIRPYRLDPLWVFDDARYALSREPFVSSATSLLDGMTQHVLGRRVDACTLVFSATRFPDAQFHLRRVRLGDQMQGGAYYDSDQWPGQEGWLCPATLHYFPNGYPENVWLQVLEGPAGS